MQLRVLQSRIDARVGEILKDRPNWPCRKGCDHCCRHLAAEPALTAVEWEAVETGLASLPLDVAAGVVERAAGPRTPVCPLLDPGTGACLIYEHRPLECRTYGFYAERDGGLYCGEILDRTGNGEFGEVVWGNHEALLRDVESQCGRPEVRLFQALALWPELPRKAI